LREAESDARMIINRSYSLKESDDFEKNVKTKADATDDIIPQTLEDDTSFITGWRIQPKYHTVLIKYLTRDGSFGTADEAREAIEALEAAAVSAAMQAVRETCYALDDGTIGSYAA
jgi:hypothetical protein